MSSSLDGERQIRRKRSMDKLIEMRIVLLGKTGSGKSSSGNTILGTNMFPVAFSPASITKHCDKQAGKVDERIISLVDTPGLFETALSQNEVEKEISKCLHLSSPGPHAFLIVMQLGRFTDEESSAVKRIQEMFGEEAIKHILLLFTHGDELDRPIEVYLEEAEDDLRKLVDSCGNRYHVINNKEPSNRDQVCRLLDMIDAMVTGYHVRYYTSELYSDVERRISEREQSLRVSYEKEMLEKEQALKEKYERQLTDLREKLQMEKKLSNENRLEMEQHITKVETEQNRQVKELQRFFDYKKRNCRQEAEMSGK